MGDEANLNDEKERQRQRKAFRRRFQGAFCDDRDHQAVVEQLEKDWAEVDEESVRALDDLE